MNIIENLYFILWVAGVVAFLIFFFHEHYKYKKFVDKLKPGVSQVRVRYSDGSVETVDKYRLYEEKWKIVYTDNVE